MKKDILVVEGEETIRQFMCETLQRNGYATVQAASAEEAISLLNQQVESVGLVLTDYHIPDGDGFELLIRVKSNPETRNIPVIFLTTEGSPEKMVAARNEGLTAWIKKPYRAENLYTQLENILK